MATTRNRRTILRAPGHDDLELDLDLVSEVLGLLRDRTAGDGCEGIVTLIAALWMMAQANGIEKARVIEDIAELYELVDKLIEKPS